MHLLLFALPLLACTLPGSVVQPAVPTLVPTADFRTPVPNATRLPLPTLPPPAENLTRPTLDPMPETSLFIGPDLSYAAQLAEGQTAVYQFQNLRNADLLIFVNPAAGFDPALQLLDAAGNAIEEIDSGGSGEPDFTRFIPPDNEVYTLQVSGVEGEVGTYTISLLDLKRSRELINITDSVEVGEIRRYDIDDAAGTPLLAILQPEADFDGMLEVYAPGGFLFNRDRGQRGEVETAVFTPDSNGYLVMVAGFQGADGAYSLRVIPIP